MTSKSTSRTEAFFAVSLRGAAGTDESAEAFADWVGRLHALAHVHAEQRSGVLLPGGTDVVFAAFEEAHDAWAAAWALRAEVEAARDGQHREGLLGIGLALGPVVELGPTRVGPPLARALRLAVAAEGRGEVLADDPSILAGVPSGFGSHRARLEQAERVGFPFHHVADYR